MECSNERHNDCQAGNLRTRVSDVVPAGRGLLHIAGWMLLANGYAVDSRLAAMHLGFIYTESARDAFP